MKTIIQDKMFFLVATFAILFGVIAAVAAFVNAYEGYSHFPDIPNSKKIRLSLSIALGAFFVISGGVIIALFFFKRFE